jgi:histidyl-tRNA synthetase
VRGLDYYSRTLFEIKGATEKLGAGDTLVCGGRYDRMIEELGGPAVPAIGFAAGLERLLIASEAGTESASVQVFVAPMGASAGTSALVLAKEIRRTGFTCELDGRGASLKAMLRRASGLGARVTLILGDTEVTEGCVQVKDMAAQSQDKVSRDQVATYVADKLGYREGREALS